LAIRFDLRGGGPKRVLVSAHDYFADERFRGNADRQSSAIIRAHIGTDVVSILRSYFASLPIIATACSLFRNGESLIVSRTFVTFPL
jgi:hypothetical protein